MVHINESKDNFIVEILTDKPYDDETLREERRRTGRYLASGIAIFLVVVGIYHAVIQGATKYATLLGTILIMFLYLLWLLFASQRKRKLLNTEEQQRKLSQLVEMEVKTIAIGKSQSHQELSPTAPVIPTNHEHKLNRTYSIA